MNSTELLAFCRVELRITTHATAGSFAITEVWLPDAWNGRTLTLPFVISEESQFPKGVNLTPRGLADRPIHYLSDGIINSPRACSFRTEALTCTPGENTSTCLTEEQIGALRRIYADYYEADQTYIFGGDQPGGEKVFATGLVGDPPFSLPQDWFRFSAKWTQEEYNASIIVLSEQLNPGQSDAFTLNHNLSAGAPHNGKTLRYVGWADQADQLISPGNNVHYYETVHAFARANTTLAVEDFYRLFPCPG
ncbi:uncharacterized protein TRAVEDRAFT_51356 [Trametes versicolor FP-101664 SS1]|uniref:uncharacterized protein n=1 Tax=Trametes versicolor (strain FP-101664) TaxID=717944 RepID=UPI0004622A78|nr:uncharacterized protein TRAVEDRAFT_51356 [Trametes versicolor FP-101664 SS1]EIW55231.1 hypothetical protein TRAVEDRAFT_51356 [Trametes versicolor FP-101664 SS1]